MNQKYYKIIFEEIQIDLSDADLNEIEFSRTIHQIWSYFFEYLVSSTYSCNAIFIKIKILYWFLIIYIK
jgi:hypothetical protein